MNKDIYDSLNDIKLKDTNDRPYFQDHIFKTMKDVVYIFYRGDEVYVDDGSYFWPIRCKVLDYKVSYDSFVDYKGYKDAYLVESLDYEKDDPRYINIWVHRSQIKVQ